LETNTTIFPPFPHPPYGFQYGFRMERSMITRRKSIDQIDQIHQIELMSNKLFIYFVSLWKKIENK
jgi:hypothetical protein